MSFPVANIAQRQDRFAPTHWSVITAAAATASDPLRARAALAELCQSYWAPLYSFVRSRGYSVHDAQDLTQSFFVHFIENEIYARTTPEKGRFRSFLLASLKNFLADEYGRAHSLKRGGGQDFLPLDDEALEAAESVFQTHGTNGPPNGEDGVFDQSWADAVVGRGLECLEAEYDRDGKRNLFQHLKIFLTGGANPLPAYDDLAVSTGLPASTLRSHVTRLRARLRELLRAQVRQTVEDDAEVDAELHELFRILAGR